jgi:hypothetical protein
LDADGEAAPPWPLGALQSPVPILQSRAELGRRRACSPPCSLVIARPFSSFPQIWGSFLHPTQGAPVLQWPPGKLCGGQNWSQSPSSAESSAERDFPSRLAPDEGGRVSWPSVTWTGPQTPSWKVALECAQRCGATVRASPTAGHGSAQSSV